MILQKGESGKVYKVIQMNLKGMVGHRLEALGLTIGTSIQVLNNKKDGSIIFKVRGTRLAVGKDIANQIVVEEAAGK